MRGSPPPGGTAPRPPQPPDATTGSCRGFRGALLFLPPLSPLLSLPVLVAVPLGDPAHTGAPHFPLFPLVFPFSLSFSLFPPRFPFFLIISPFPPPLFLPRQQALGWQRLPARCLVSLPNLPRETRPQGAGGTCHPCHISPVPEPGGISPAVLGYSASRPQPGNGNGGGQGFFSPPYTRCPQEISFSPCFLGVPAEPPESWGPLPFNNKRYFVIRKKKITSFSTPWRGHGGTAQLEQPPRPVPLLGWGALEPPPHGARAALGAEFLPWPWVACSGGMFAG